METYDFFYGTQMVEIEREEVPEVVERKKLELQVNSSVTKVVILNVCN